MYAKIETFQGNIIASGKIVNIKTTINGNINVDLISFDHKWFFRKHGSKHYKTILSNTITENIVFEKNKYVELTYDKWSNAFDTYKNDIDVYEEYTYNEIDLEVKQLCDVLNKIPGIITTGSCSGHNKTNAFINIKFKDINAITVLLKIITCKTFRFCFILSSDNTIIIPNGAEYPELKLKTVNIGKVAYKDINRLVEYIKIMYLN